MSAQIPINTIKNSCIVNNTNIAMQNVPNPQGTLTPLDATNNWWGMPVGASDQNRAGGDWVGWNITNQPHLTTIPQNCDLSDANWIPFSEQELQNAILSQLPYVGALDFVLLDMQKGYGAKFTLVAKPEYGGQRGEAYISIAPSDDGTWMMLMLDFSRLPTTTASDNLSQIATCSLMPLFLNSLQQVQSRFTQPSQLIEQMVVMDSALMILFTAPTEITPDPSPSLVMNYDSSCLPIPMTPTPAPTPVSPQDEDESGLQVNIPPRDGGIGLMELGDTQGFLTLGYYYRYKPVSTTITGTYTDYYSAGTILSGGAVSPFTWHDAGAVNHRRTWGGYHPSSPKVYTPAKVIDMALGNTTLNHHVLVNNIEVIQAYYGPNCSTTTWHLRAKLTYEDNTTATFESESAPLAPADLVFDDNYPFRLYELDIPDTGKYVKKLIVETVNTCENSAGNLYIEYRLQDVRVNLNVYGACETQSVNLAGAMALSETQGDAPIICQVPPTPIPTPNVSPTPTEPPNSEQCSARIANPYDKSDNPGFDYYSIRKFPKEGTPEMISPRPAHYSSVIVKGRDLYAGGGVSWWYVEYNHNGTPIIGWIRVDGVEIDSSIVDGCNINDIERVPIIDFDDDANNDGTLDDPIINTLTVEPIYDYPLGVPLPPWYSDMPNFEELKNNWKNFSIDEQLNKWHSEGEASSDDCTGSGEEPIRRNCTLLVYVVFHDLFRKIYQRDLMLSDIFAVTYNLELGPALDFRRSDVAQQALGANYFGIIRQYCHDTQGLPFDEIIIGVDENANCKPNDIPIEELVHSYTYIDQETSISVTKTGYLATLQAWYDDAVYISNWYYGTDLSLIQTIDNISNEASLSGAVRLRLLLPPPADQANTFVSKLQLQSQEKRPRYSDTIRPWEYVVWGNHAYSTASDSPYNTVINIWKGQGANPNTVSDPDGNLIKFCVLNMYHPSQHNPPNGGEDVFIIHTTSPDKHNYGQTTTFESGMRPNWTFGALLPEIGNAPYTSLFDDTRLCPCLITPSNERYPDNRENARRCYD